MNINLALKVYVYSVGPSTTKYNIYDTLYIKTRPAPFE